jgi:hypothetical protein
MLVSGKLPLLGRLPGDPIFRKNGFTLFLPIGNVALLSLVITVVANLVFRFFR